MVCAERGGKDEKGGHKVYRMLTHFISPSSSEIWHSLPLTTGEYGIKYLEQSSTTNGTGSLWKNFQGEWVLPHALCTRRRPSETETKQHGLSNLCTKISPTVLVGL
jgi:hypothetical protein